jgi:toxin CptA
VWTIAGGALLGLGAYVNQACVFGAIARLGSGDWAYVATPVGFYVGCASVGAVFAAPAAHRLNEGSPVLQASMWWVLPFVAFTLWRVARGLFGARAATSARECAARVWSPHAATTVIGITFLGTLLLVGRWAYTEALADLARGMSMSLAAKFVLLLALFVGALWGGWTAGRFRSTRIGTLEVLRCFAGGILMGWGSLLIPGANDGLILIGMPLLWPYAWLAFLTMCVTIGAAMLARKALLPRLARN